MGIGDGILYEGYWRDDKPHGKGLVIVKDGHHQIIDY